MELSDAVRDQLDVKGVLAFAEHLLTNAAPMWLGLDEKQELQRVLFPEGLRFDREKFGTAITCSAFKKLDETGGLNSGMAYRTLCVPDQTRSRDPDAASAMPPFLRLR
jgi:hypothetical protein